AYHAHQVATVPRRGMNVVTRFEFMGQFVQGVVECAAVERRKVARHRHVGDTADGEADSVRSPHRSAGDDGKIAVASRHLAKGAALSGGRKRSEERRVGK